MHTKRRQNNMNNAGGQARHNNNPRARRFGGGRQHGADDSANVARVRRNATQSREKYQNLAREAMSAGDRVLAENYLQHADHYYRVLLALPPEEVRQHSNRNQHQHNADAVAGGEQQGDNAEPQAGGPSASEGAHGHALPSFITSPAVPENVPHEAAQE